MLRAFAGLVLTLLAGCGGNTSEPAPHTSSMGTAPATALLPAVTLPDISDMDPAVQQQVREQFTAVTRADRQAAPAERAREYGRLGSLLFAANRANAAETAYLHAQSLAPDDRRWPYYLGHVYMNRPDRPKAIASFERALQQQPDDVATLVWLGKVFLDDGQSAQAETHFTRALAAQPRTAAALYGLGQAALAQQQYARAVERFEELLTVDPRASIAHYPLALAYRGLGDVKKAEAHLREQGTVQVGPPDPLMAELRALLGGSAAEEARGIRAAEGGDYVTAVSHFRRGVELAPDSVSLRYNLARALSLTGDMAGAAAAFEETVRLAPKDADVRVTFGELLGRGGHYQEALAQYEQAMALDPRAAEARFGYAGALVGLRRYHEAIASLSDSAKRYPDDKRFSEALARVRNAAR
jgi:tetratricopeptide (TPR) repeat protein